MLQTVFSYFYAQQPPPGLLRDLQESEDPTEPLRQAFTYLAHNPHAKLESIVREKFNFEISRLFKAEDSEALKYSILEGYCRMASLEELKEQVNVADPVAIAKKEAVFLPQPPRTVEPLSSPIARYWSRYFPLFGRTAHWMIVLPVSLGAATLHHATHFFGKPGASFSEIKSLLILPHLTYKTVGKPLLGAAQFVTDRISSRAALVFLVASGALAYGGVYYLAQHVFKLGAPTQVDKRGAFENMNEQVKEGTIKEGIERTDIQNMVLRHWEETGLDLPFLIPFLVGLAGSGKTQFVEHLAWRCVYDKTFEHYGTTVFYVNATELLALGSEFIDKVLWKIEGHKGKIILVFDEAHNLAKAKEGKWNPLEKFKTLLLKKNIRCIMASTQKECDKYIAPNDAFVDRVRMIDVKPLNEKLTKHLLNKLCLKYDPTAIAPEAIKAIWDITNTGGYKDRANPRKALQALQEVLSAAQIWKPQGAAQSRLEKAMVETAEVGIHVVNTFADEQWILSEEANTATDALRKLRSKIQKYENIERMQKEKLQEIKFLRSREKILRGEIAHLVHELDREESPSPEKQKQYLATKFIRHPHVRNSLQKAREAFREEFSEEIPLVIDEEFVKQCLELQS